MNSAENINTSSIVVNGNLLKNFIVITILINGNIWQLMYKLYYTFF